MAGRFSFDVAKTVNLLFLGIDGKWIDNLDDARVFDDEASALVQLNQCLKPNSFEVSVLKVYWNDVNKDCLSLH
ncbi:hypothetical protein QUB05_26340 [Microcoleus sp. F10-C6]|uniref:hypothetical protein n=1 Tax=unclassified Microcoleus TaxID=2642155 RepID=UPI002FD0E009